MKSHHYRWAYYVIAGAALLVVFGVMSWVVSEKAGRDAAQNASREISERSREANGERRRGQIEGCERGKLDRLDDIRDLQDDSRVFERLTIYYEGVIAARSVEEDVKVQARLIHDSLEDAVKRKRKGVESLRSRILLCVPLVDEGMRIPDTKFFEKHLGDG